MPDHLIGLHSLISCKAQLSWIITLSELVDLDVQELKPTPEKSIFDEMFWPFLQIITNERVLDSMVLEKVVGDIYAFLYGVQGRRAIKFFGSLLTTLADHTPTPHTIEIDLLLRVNAILVALGSLLEGNQGAAIHEQLRPVIDTLQTYLDMPAASVRGTLEEQNAAMAMSKVRRHLDYGGNLPILPDRQSNLTPAASFELTRDSPGALSKAGARHDNDHANITDIKILPTNDEILSERPEYLPTKDSVKWHVGGIQGLLDQQFRLLREDTVGQLRDSVRTVLEGLRQRRFTRSGGANALRIFKYTNVTLADVSYDARRRCLQITATFDQPEFLRRKARYDRQKWWNECKQLQIDSLVCLVDSDGNSTFFTVAERGGLVKRREEGHSRSGGGRPRMSWQVSPTMNLWANDTRATATLRLIDVNNQGFSTVFGRMTTTAHVRQVLVEFPGVLLAAFQHTLEAIQRMSKHGQVPFAPILVPDAALAGDKVVQWPRYTTPTGFFWDLSCLTADHRPLHLARNQAFNIEALKSQSTLDEAQCKALVAALSRSLALIQGPPGTGKSFVAVQAMKVLLAHKAQARLGPIICVCYTNHALDQFLEHLITDGTGNVIRIGSQSKSEIIEPLNLRYVAQKMARTKTEKQQEFNLRNELEASGEFVIELFRDISNAGSLRAVTNYLQHHHELHYEDLTTLEDSHGFKVAGKGKDNLSKWLSGHSELQLSEARTINELSRTPLLEMQNNERHKLYRFWVARIRDGLGERLRTALRRFSNLENQLNGCIQEVDLRCLQQANVIGVTTSGLARNVNLLARLHSKVLVCEEAGEILEAHTLTAILPSIEHAILIGDHEQLRPQIQNFDLSLENRSGEQYSLDVSTFERLIRHPTSEIPYETLETQRRMDPSISDLIRKTLYPGLRDHDTVLDYPTIPGVRKRLFWLDHREHEVGKAGGNADGAVQMSQSNDYEVGLIAAMVSHLVRQGFYGSEDIVVLTPYVRQLQKIRTSLASSFEIVVDDRDAEEINRRGLAETPSDSAGTHKAMLTQTLRVATVDNFQGEEAKVIIVSLVRSNEERRCGFLKTSNRINVLLSRAKHGMYIIGNSDTASSVAMWAQVIEMFKRGGNFGPKLPLCCSQHPDTVIELNADTRSGSNVARMVWPKTSNAWSLAALIYHVVISAKDLAISAERGGQMAAASPSTKAASLPVDGDSPPVLIPKCGPKSVKEAVVDYIEGRTYAEIDLDHDPCLFPDCGHVITMQSLDGQMGLSAHYEMSKDGLPTEPKSQVSAPLSVEAKGCPLCRGSLRNLNRYNRIVKRALLDESTKRFITWSNAQFVPLTVQLQKAEKDLEGLKEKQVVLTKDDKKPEFQHSEIVIAGVRDLQISILHALPGFASRVGRLIVLRHQIAQFHQRVMVTEQPFGKVSQMTATVVRSTGHAPNFKFDKTVLQTRSELLASSLLLRCDYDLLADLIYTCSNCNIFTAQLHPWVRKPLKFDLSKNREDCVKLAGSAALKQQPMIFVEAHTLFAKFAALECSAPAYPENVNVTKLMDQAKDHLELARSHIFASPSLNSKIMLAEVEAVEEILKDSSFYKSFYTSVESDEKQAIYNAMAQEFQGTGHWYYCENAHPFTIGECGMPMQASRCPQCGARVGGQNHDLVEGVTRAADLEEAFGNVRLIDV
ncbi:MAG: hypothetical protein OHK93_006909 [Ramalina farinacea]|uniref:RZ-type domain-containing protein n=1 Tax=Ramalina farinacea TaxID=258253 RepID=A0AA43QLP5_9LECA|nr:hypothetical protein [Ramalina farinacea]